MKSEEFARLERIILHAAALPEEERSAYLDEACRSPELRAKAEAMLANDPGEIDSISGDDTTVEALPDTSSSKPEDEEIGPYRLLERIGEGGMGSVYLAQQEQPVRRKVALKVIKRGMDTKQVVARFEAERQALALMDHPNIAKVFDAGSTPRGRPYFVMEHVKGVPITTYCDKHRLTTRERLELFMQVCDGVQHAHQKAIIHRDLKPSNLLVTIQDDEPVPKIIDFGVAKATTQKLTEKTVYTALGELIGTPEYMSPEQAEMTGEDVDTRTDVYSLGVVLYELLAGALPFESEKLRSAGFQGIVQMIREQDPPRPSTKVSTLGQRTTGIAASRRTMPGKLRSQLRGDLDWITMRTLEKDRTRRYGSAAELAADLRRHLQHEPVVAGPPSAAYRAAKFIRRNRIGVSFAGALLVVLAGVAITMTVQAGRIASERDRANVERDRANVERDRANAEADRANREAATSDQVSEFLVSVFNVSDPGGTRDSSVTARAVLDNGAERIRRELADQPLLRAKMMTSMGRVYDNLGLYTTAESLLVGALELRCLELGEEHLDTIESLSHLGWLRLHQGQWGEATDIYELALSVRERELGAEHVDTARSMYGRAVCWLHAQNPYEARRLYERALPVFEEELGPEALEVAWCLNDMGHYTVNDPDSQLVLLRRSLEIKTKVLGPDHYDVQITRDNIGSVLMRQGRFREAKSHFDEALEHTVKSQGPKHYNTASNLGSIGNALYELGEYAAAADTLRLALRIATAAVGPDHWLVAFNLRCLAKVFVATGDHAEADSLFQGSAKADSSGGRQDSVWLHAGTLEAHAQFLRDINRVQEADLLVARAQVIREKAEQRKIEQQEGTPSSGKPVHPCAGLQPSQRKTDE